MVMKGYLNVQRTRETNLFTNPSIFRIFPQKDNTGLLQKGSPSFSPWTASHSSQSV